MKILSFDPGETTGIASVDTETKTCELRSWKVDPDTWVYVTEDIDLILIEAHPANTNNHEQTRIYGMIFDSILASELPYIVIHQSSWKPIAKALKWRHPEAKSDHEQDAYNLVRYHLYNVFNKDIGAYKCE